MYGAVSGFRDCVDMKDAGGQLFVTVHQFGGGDTRVVELAADAVWMKWRYDKRLKHLLTRSTEPIPAGHCFHL